MKELIDQLLTNKGLSEADTFRLFESIFAGRLSDSQIAAVLSAWRILGETEKELYAGARLMRKAATRSWIPDSFRPLTDNCGTGGDGADSFNISTFSAIIAASCGVSMVKHGNRSVSSKCGGADLLFAMGYPDKLNADQSCQLLEETGLTFLFAPNFHPVMKHVMPVRKSLGLRTIFNLLGPLCNPLAPEFQLLGVGHKDALAPVAKCLSRLGVSKALVVHSQDGMDEISASAVTDGFFIEEDAITPWSFDPLSIGIRPEQVSVKGGNITENTRIMKELLENQDCGAKETVLLNAAAVLWIRGLVPSIEQGYAKAKKSLDSGNVRDFFNRWIQKARSLAGENQ